MHTHVPHVCVAVTATQQQHLAALLSCCTIACSYASAQVKHLCNCCGPAAISRATPAGLPDRQTRQARQTGRPDRQPLSTLPCRQLNRPAVFTARHCTAALCCSTRWTRMVPTLVSCLTTERGHSSTQSLVQATLVGSPPCRRCEQQVEIGGLVAVLCACGTCTLECDQVFELRCCSSCMHVHVHTCVRLVAVCDVNPVRVRSSYNSL